jgi:hypothetical protein
MGAHLMSGHIYRINFLQWITKESKKAKGTKKAKFQAFFVLFVFFASTLPFTANPDFENVPRHQGAHSKNNLIGFGHLSRDFRIK